MSEPTHPSTSTGEIQQLAFAIGILTLVGLAAVWAFQLYLGPLLATYLERLGGPMRTVVP
jgi:hypothetical protein